jgi:NAD(P)-dependent dehydrogenase (short-subunit alcohol dehydrogenase family)
MKILITGAGKGIGFECCKEALKLGHEVFGVSRSVEHLKSLQNENKENLHVFSTNLISENAIQSLVSEIKNQTLTIDVLINNAGLIVNKAFYDISEDELSQVYKTNVFVPFLLTQAVLPLMKNSQQKHIVNISSMGGVNGSSKFAGLSAYSSSKGALSTLTECLAEELKPENIRVNALAIGAVDTMMLREAFPGYKADVTASEMAKHIISFSTAQPLLYNGKVIQVSNSTP